MYKPNTIKQALSLQSCLKRNHYKQWKRDLSASSVMFLKINTSLLDANPTKRAISKSPFQSQMPWAIFTSLFKTLTTSHSETFTNSCNLCRSFRTKRHSSSKLHQHRHSSTCTRLVRRTTGTIGPPQQVHTCTCCHPDAKYHSSIRRWNHPKNGPSTRSTNLQTEFTCEQATQTGVDYAWMPTSASVISRLINCLHKIARGSQRGKIYRSPIHTRQCAFVREAIIQGAQI